MFPVVDAVEVPMTERETRRDVSFFGYESRQQINKHNRVRENMHTFIRTCVFGGELVCVWVGVCLFVFIPSRCMHACYYCRYTYVSC